MGASFKFSAGMCNFRAYDLLQSIGNMFPKVPVMVHHILRIKGKTNQSTFSSTFSINYTPFFVFNYINTSFHSTLFHSDLFFFFRFLISISSVIVCLKIKITKIKSEDNYGSTCLNGARELGVSHKCYVKHVRSLRLLMIPAYTAV